MKTPPAFFRRELAGFANAFMGLRRYKTRQALLCGLIATFSATAAWAWTPPGADWQISERGPDHRKWTRLGQTTNESGVVVLRTNTIIELSGGMHVNTNGAWVDAHPEIVPVAGGALCRGARHTVWLANNLNTWASVRVHTETDSWVKANVLGLGYYDTNSGKAVLIAQVKDCQGAIVASNQILYADAFDGLKADVRYTYGRATFEQDVILRQRPPAPETVGLKADNVTLYALTELVDTAAPERVTFKAPPPAGVQPVLTNATDGVTNALVTTNAPLAANGKGRLANNRRPVVSAPPEDALSFGGMLLGRGKAFEVGTNAGVRLLSLTNRLTGAVRQVRQPGKNTPVRAQWFQTQGRSFLMEQVPLRAVRQELQKLPLTAQAQAPWKTRGNLYRVFDHVVAPELELARESKDRMLLAKAQEGRPGFLMDYNLLSGSYSGFVFDYYSTYVVDGYCYLDGTITIREGAVIKYAPNGNDMYFCGPVVCPQWDWAYITSTEDDSVPGESTSQGAGLYPGCYDFGLHIDGSSSGPCQLQNLQISYAQNGVYLQDSAWPATAHTVNNCSFNDCVSPFYLEQTKVESSGCSFYSSDNNSTEPFVGSYYLFTGNGLSFDLWGWDYFAVDTLDHDTGTSPQSAVRLSACTISARDGVSTPTSVNGPVVVLLDPPAVTITATDKTAVKGTTDTGIFTFSRSGDTSQDLYVAFTVSGSAVAGVDYSALPSGVTIPQGSSTATLTVTAGEQNFGGPSRCTTKLTLSGSTTYLVGSPNTATISITDPSVPLPPEVLLNIDFAASTPQEVGFAATGLSDTDYWNSCDRGASNLAWSDGSGSAVGITVANAPGGWGLNSGDVMYNTYLYPYNGGNITATITNLFAGTYDFYLYGHGDAVEQSSRFQLATPSTTTDWRETAQSVTAQTSCDWQEGVQYVVFRGVPLAPGEPVTVSVAPGGSSYAVLNGMQIVGTHPDPTIFTQPTNQAVAAAGAASFSVSAGGMPPLSYQWRFNGANIAGATSSSYSLTGVSTAQSGEYSVVVSNSFGSIESIAAVLTVVPADWFVQYWGANYQTNPNAAPGADPNGNGLSNWQEFLMGRNPLATSTTSDTAGTIGLRVFTPLK